MTEQRKREIKEERSQGEAAFHAGKGSDSNPYSVDCSSWGQWCGGWYAAAAEKDSRELSAKQAVVSVLPTLEAESARQQLYVWLGAAESIEDLTPILEVLIARMQ